MNQTSLKNLDSDELQQIYAVHSSSTGLRKAMSRNPIVNNLTSDIESGIVTIDNLKEVISAYLVNFTAGQSIDSQAQLCAIVTALEPIFNVEFLDILKEFADCKIAELSQVWRVAVECYKNNRNNFVPTSYKTFQFSVPIYVDKISIIDGFELDNEFTPAEKYCA